jgi:RNA polymerase sigma-70 factor (ECF subfamily)
MRDGSTKTKVSEPTGLPADRELVRDLYQAELQPVRKFLRRLGAPLAHLDDLVHDVFITAYQRISTFDRSRRARPWLFAIALRRYWSFNQRASLHREIHQEATWVEAGGPSAPELLAGHEERAILMRALDTLDLERRAVFVMHEIDGLTAPEIAESLEIPLNTVYSRLRRAREVVERAVRSLSGEGEAP